MEMIFTLIAMCSGLCVVIWQIVKIRICQDEQADILRDICDCLISKSANDEIKSLKDTRKENLCNVRESAPTAEQSNLDPWETHALPGSPYKEIHQPFKAKIDFDQDDLRKFEEKTAALFNNEAPRL